jgi:hypothetical protein
MRRPVHADSTLTSGTMPVRQAVPDACCRAMRTAQGADCTTLPATLRDWMLCAAMANSVLWLDELTKLIVRQLSRRR